MHVSKQFLENRVLGSQDTKEGRQIQIASFSVGDGQGAYAETSIAGKFWNGMIADMEQQHCYWSIIASIHRFSLNNDKGF